MKHLFRLFICLTVGLLVTSCFFFQSAEGDKHRDYPNILMEHDSLSFPLRAIPIDIPNKRYFYSGDCQKNKREDVPNFERFEVNGEHFYYGGTDEEENYLLYDNTLKLVAKSEHYPRVNVHGQLYQFGRKDNASFMHENTLITSDFYTGETINTIHTIASFNWYGYDVFNKELMKQLPEVTDSTQIKQYITDLCANNEVYLIRTNDNQRYYVFPENDILIHVDANIVSSLDVPLYDQEYKKEKLTYTGNDFQLIKTETVSHSLFDPGGRGNFLLMMATLYMHYYDFIAEGDTLRIKSFRELELVETIKEKERYIVILGGVRGTDHNYFFEYVPKGERD